MVAPWLKPLDALVADDLRALVASRAQESETLEFKGAMYELKGRMHQRKDKDVQELLKDVASMANHRGGRIMIGVRENRRTGTALAVDGVDSAGATERILSTCYAHIQPRVGGLDVRYVELGGDSAVVVLHIPESLAAPHLVTFNEINLFYRRYGRQNRRMSVREIEAAFYSRFQAGEALQRFVAERKNEAHAALGVGSGPGGGGNARGLFLTCTPVHLMDEAVDIHDHEIRRLMQSPPQLPNRPSVGCGDVLPSLHGLSARREGRPDHLDVWRTGHIQFLGTRRWGGDGDTIPSAVVAHFLYSFALFAQRVYERAVIESPSVVTCNFLNARGLHLGVGRSHSYSDDLDQRPLQDDTLEMDPVYAETVASLHEMPRRVMDRLYNAFGLDRCELFDEDGQLITS